MEKSNNRVLNELLVNLFHNVMDAEARVCPGSRGNSTSPWEP